ncbi:sugar ABC transporter ATP-binding protein [Bacillus sp. FJAT-42315]|uniref:sugar ABC transporter ATP-binding protein n=1 Tax=Bacillus sp. FJAT-42315 TaxID=2014077 RepID=UPI000C23DCEC|nr:sugar ABC transporter ATP-binding protein [Bacillus sp. FJAT-42315]
MIELKNISIDFPGVAALKDVDVTIEKGKAHALIGANGAGKSTLMKVLSGAYDHYRGEIFIDGKKVNIRSPKEAKQQGIQMVYQEVDAALIPYLTVAENIMQERIGQRLWINWKTTHKQAADILASLQVFIPTDKRIDQLTLAEKQMVLIAKAISDDCRCLILDEPTAPLSHAETEELFQLIRLLKQQGVAIIFISHRLPELFEICEEITVMRNGSWMMTKCVEDTSTNEVIEQMLGKKLAEQYPKSRANIGEPILQVSGLSDERVVKNLSIHVSKGEIVGISGLVGAGKTEICQALFGASSQTTGDIKLYGKKVNISSPAKAVSHGLVLVPEERRKEGIVTGESVTTNLSIANVSRFSRLFGWMDRRAEKRAAEHMIEQLNIVTPSAEAKVEHLSGGNQQKVVIGKWLMGEAEVYVFDEPTKGVDVGAKREIFDLIARLANEGKGIIYASSELDDILGMTDRVYVVYDGEVVKELDTAATNEAEILFYSTGGK